MSAPEPSVERWERSRDRDPRLALAALAILFAVQCTIGAVAAISHQSAFSEYLGQARRCVELDDCPSRGGRSGGLPLFHGASWIRLLSYSLRAGVDLTRVQSIVLGSWILSMPVAFFFLRRHLGLRAAALALGLYFPVILVGTDVTDLTYTNLLPLPWALYFAGTARFTETGRIVFAAGASVALAAAVSAELGSIVMVPFHVLIVAVTARRRVAAVAAAGLAFAIPYGWESTDAALDILRQVPTVRFAVGLAISGGVVALTARMSPWLLQPASLPVPDRVRAVMTAALIYATVAIWLAGLLLMHGWPNPRYFLPASFPFLYLVAERMGTLPLRSTLLAAALLCLSLLLLPFAPHASVLQVPVVFVVTLYALATLRREMARSPGRAPAGALWPTAAICLCAVALSAADIVVLPKRGPAQAFTLAEAEPLISKVYASGYTYPALVGALQGPAADGLMSLLTERDPNLFAEPPYLSNQDFSLLAIKVPTAAIARTRGVVAAVPVSGWRSAIVVRGDRRYLDWLRMRRCGWTDDQYRPAAYGCVAPRPDRPLPRNWPYVEFGDPDPAVHGPDGPRAGSIRFEVPVRTPGQGVPHVVRTANQWPNTWRIVRVSGVEFEGILPGEEIRLPDTRAAAGVVEFEYTAAVPGDLPWVWIPHVVEVAADHEHLLEPLRGAP